MPIPQEYFKAGRIASEVREELRGRNYVGKSLLEVCNSVEGLIRSKGAEPAFPCNVCLNDIAAHYTPLEDDRRVIKEGDLVKVDIGVHVNGYIADTAITLSYNPEYDGLVQAADGALAEAIKALSAGVRAGDLGRVISSVAKRRGLKPITNLSGHLIEQFSIHAGKSVPNVWVPATPPLKAGEVYAIEPFLTTVDGAGYVVEGEAGNIYSLITRKRLGDRDLDELLNLVWNLFRTLPFTLRWLTGASSVKKLEEMLHKLVLQGLVRAYPILREASRRPVAQSEHTVAPTEKGVIVLTQ